MRRAPAQLHGKGHARGQGQNQLGVATTPSTKTLCATSSIRCSPTRPSSQSSKAFVAKIAPAGRINSLAQTLMKYTSPGVPDLYQGGELWDYSLVDPDNRRPVDYDLRRKLLNELRSMTAEQVMKRMDEGLPKMWVIHHALVAAARASALALALREATRAAQRAGRRRNASSPTCAVATCLQSCLAGRTSRTSWNGTTLELPEGRWTNCLTGQHFEGLQPIENLLAVFPVSLLVLDRAAGAANTAHASQRLRRGRCTSFGFGLRARRSCGFS